MNKDLNIFTPRVVYPYKGIVKILVYHTNWKQGQCIIAKTIEQLVPILKEKLKMAERGFKLEEFWEGATVDPPVWWLKAGQEYFYKKALDEAKDDILFAHAHAFKDLDINETVLAYRCPHEFRYEQYKKEYEEFDNDDDREDFIMYHIYCKCDSRMWVLKPEIDIEHVFWKCYAEQHLNNDWYRGYNWTNRTEVENNNTYYQWYTISGHHQPGVVYEEMKEEEPYFGGCFNQTNFIFQGAKKDIPVELQALVDNYNEEQKKKEEARQKKIDMSYESQQDKEKRKALEKVNSIIATYLK